MNANPKIPVPVARDAAPMEAPRLKVLVAGDEASGAPLLSSQLPGLGFDPITARSGEEAVAKFEAERPDIVMMDVAMRGPGALEILPRIKALAGERPVAVVLLAAAADDGALAAGLAAGAEDCLVKPFHPALVASRIGSIARTLRLRLHLEQALESARESQAQLRSHYLQAPVAYQSMDAEGRILEVNHAWEKMVGLSQAQVAGIPYGDLVEPASRPVAADALAALIAEGRATSPVLELRNRLTGAPIHVQVMGRAEFGSGGAFLRTHCNLVDVTARVSAEAARAALMDQLRIHASLFQWTRDGVVIADADQRIIDVNPAFTEIMGYTREEILGKTPRAYSAGLTPRSVYADMWREIRDRGAWRGELINRRKSGVAHPEMVSIVAVKEAGEVRHYVGILSRVNAHRDDMVTGLPGRRAMRTRLGDVIESARRSGRRAALLVLDIDHFTEINAAMGFDVGDMLLRETAQRLRNFLRRGDQAFRIGADEFAVVPADADEAESFEERAERLPATLAEPFHLGNEVVHASVSVGVAFHPEDAGDVEAMITNADHAMQKAKPRGGGKLEYFVTAHQREARERRRLVDDLRLALADDRFTLAFQPIVELATGRVHKAEALVRWKHPVHGLVYPDAFVPAAERTGLIRPIGAWVFGEAVSSLRQLRLSRPDFRMSVNLSAAQLLDRDFQVHDFLQILEDAGVPGSALVLEFTEGMLLGASEVVLRRFEEFRAAGLKLAIDDFGTGYSSLSYLHSFHVDYLKIDQSFVRVADGEERKQALCQAIVTMGHSLGLKVIAEGVETAEQDRRMRALRCDFGQGYLYGRPMSLADMEQLLQGNGATCLT